MRPPADASRGGEPWGLESGPSGGRRALTSLHLRSALRRTMSPRCGRPPRDGRCTDARKRENPSRGQDSSLDDAQDPLLASSSSPLSQVPCRPPANWAAAGSPLRGASRLEGPETVTGLVAKPQRRRTHVLLQAERSGWSAALWVVPTPPPSRTSLSANALWWLASARELRFVTSRGGTRAATPLRGRVRDLMSALNCRNELRRWRYLGSPYGVVGAARRDRQQLIAPRGRRPAERGDMEKRTDSL
jgi:hypothetical protein